jgi:hypothetical protein
MRFDDDRLEEAGFSIQREEGLFDHYANAPHSSDFDEMGDSGDPTGLSLEEDGVIAHKDSDDDVKGFSICDEDKNLRHSNMDQEMTGYSIMEEVAIENFNGLNYSHYNMDDEVTGVSFFSPPLKNGIMVFHFKIKE